MTVSFRIENPDAVKSWFDTFGRDMRSAFQDAARALVEGAAERAKDRVRSPARAPRSRSGAYLRSLRSETRATPFRVRGRVVSGSPVAAVIEFGSRPHRIRPRRREALFWPGAPHPVKLIHHPGTPAFRVLTEAAEDAGRAAESLLTEAVRRQFRS